MTELERFIIALDEKIQGGARAEQALRAIVMQMAEKIRLREAEAKDPP